ncbi:ADP-ribosylglycohydrolase family protein [Leifsonia shinshuensis]|uniref:ADP-ribosylglycohydrolase family protein n=1 Tax=Leifsonia shinshuensis TaxID=150026 RepID=UPI001F505144|nr:ADP-ribosylglycohydrolase family protein [Leifsonia shinshuensis]MCI0157093.1 ADP-ribosylglycohydrolase family protein [Leifsonia shinshuensis]
MNWLRERTAAVLAGSAIGDALGGAAEGFSAEAIKERYGGPINGVVPPYHADWQTARLVSPYHKGDGHITDDTLMVQALIQVYAKHRDHLDAFAIAETLVPLLQTEVRWIPELERETILLHRVFLAEKWLVTRLQYGHIDPREAGVGNAINCGAAMYMAPVGIVNAGNPRRAYAEAIDIAGAHQASYGREAAGIFAAAVAAAVAPGATVASVIEASLRYAHDGSKAAIEAVTAAAMALPESATDDEIIAALRDAVRPYDTVGEAYREPNMDARLPSRTKSIEELPIALGLLIAYDGDFRRSILAAVNYGRDSDSIASMVGSLAGGLGGWEAVAIDWLDVIAEASRVDFGEYADRLADVAEEIQQSDIERARADIAVIEGLGVATGALR